MNCTYCKSRTATAKCGGCAAQYYCGQTCATMHWTRIHSQVCNFALIEAEKRGRSVDIFTLANNGDVEGLREAFLSGKASVNDRNEEGDTVLTTAALYGKEEVVKFLLKAPMIDVNARDNDGWSALMLASRYSNDASTEETVRLLLEHPRIDPNIQSHNGWTALMLACSYSNKDSTEGTVRLLLKHSRIDPNIQNHKGWTALIMASRYSTKGTVRLLLEHPRINPNIQEENGWTALIMASRYSTKGTVRLLLEHPRINPNIQNHNGWTALMMAARYDTKQTIRLLLEHPLTNPMLVNEDGETAMDLCQDVACKLFMFSLVIARKRIGDPQIPFSVARMIMARKIQMEICEGLTDEPKDNLLELASLLEVSQDVYSELLDQSKEAICTFISDILSFGSMWDAELYARRQRQKKAMVAQGFYNKFRDYMLYEFDEDIRQKSVAEIEQLLSKLINRP